MWWNKQPETPVKETTETKKEKGTMTAKNEYRIVYADKDVTVYADRVGTGNGFYFWRDSDLVAHFPAGTAFTRVDNDPRPAPVPGVDYYTLEDLTRALKDLNYYSTDKIVEKVRQRLSVRDDGRYTIGELKAAVKQVDSISGVYHAERFDAAALQARKNRVWDAHTC